ncbi:MAG: hypothetical protein ABEJ96_02705, partial [Thiohalorhabdaceae bacterium]
MSDRTRRYVSQGAFIVRHSNVLLALWDGCQVPGTPGGTGNIVRLMLNGDMDWGEAVRPASAFTPRSLTQGGEPGMVLHLPASRADPPAERETVPLQDQLGKGREWKGLPRSVAGYFVTNGRWREAADLEPGRDLLAAQRSELRSTLAKVEAFNRDAMAARATPHLPPDLPPDAESEVAVPARGAGRLFGVAEQLARFRQKQLKRYVAFLFAAIAAGVIGFELFTAFVTDRGPWGWLGLGLFALGYVSVAAVFGITRLARLR